MVIRAIIGVILFITASGHLGVMLSLLTFNGDDPSLVLGSIVCVVLGACLLLIPAIVITPQNMRYNATGACLIGMAAIQLFMFGVLHLAAMSPDSEDKYTFRPGVLIFLMVVEIGLAIVLFKKQIRDRTLTHHMDLSGSETSPQTKNLIEKLAKESEAFQEVLKQTPSVLEKENTVGEKQYESPSRTVKHQKIQLKAPDNAEAEEASPIAQSDNSKKASATIQQAEEVQVIENAFELADFDTGIIPLDVPPPPQYPQFPRK